MGEHGRPFFPLIASLAIFVLVSNLSGLIPGFYPPTANINTTAACAVVVFLATHFIGIKQYGFVLPYGTITAELCPACGNVPERDVKSKSSFGLQL